jgi:hypothetical protein
MDVLKVLGIIALGNAIVWGLFFWQRRRLIHRTRLTVERSGESWVIPPENGYYQGMLKGIVSSKTMGAMGLTDGKLIFIPPLGHNMEYPLKDVVEVSENTWFAGNYRNGREFMILKFTDGNEVGFQVGNQQRWVEEIRSRINT